jgi:hypothetical protein
MPETLFGWFLKAADNREHGRLYGTSLQSTCYQLRLEYKTTNKVVLSRAPHPKALPSGTAIRLWNDVIARC